VVGKALTKKNDPGKNKKKKVVHTMENVGGLNKSRRAGENPRPNTPLTGNRDFLKE